jgi:hypothetical protein
MPPTPMQAWFNLSLGEMGRGPLGAVRHDISKGDATPATAAVRRKWRRDQGAGSKRRLAGFRI